MKINQFPGYFIAVEGLDGSGSDEVVKALKRKLRREGYPLKVVKEPSSGPVGLLIKKLLLKKETLSPLQWEFLFAADREWLMENQVIPVLGKGQLVISDRCLWSSIAYRSFELPIHWLLEINKRFFIPNITYFIDVAPQICASRIKKGLDELQIFSTEERLAQIQDGYHWIFNKYPYWFKVIDGERDEKVVVEEVFNDIVKREKVKKIISKI